MRRLGVSIAGVLCLSVGCQSVEDDGMATGIAASAKATVAPSSVTDAGKATTRSEGAKGGTVEFSMNVKQTGSYRVRVWGSGIAAVAPTTMYIDGRPAGTLNMRDNGWQYYDVVSRNGQKVMTFTAGKHVIAFTNNLNRAPDIESVQIASGEFPLAAADGAYGEYIARLKQNVLTSDYGAKKRAGLDDGQQTQATPGSKGTYCYSESVQFSYTFRSFYYLNAGQSVSFSTKRSDGNQYGSDPYMYLTDLANPSVSYYNDDYLGYQPRISISSVPYSGTYMLLIRAYSSSNPGTTDFYMNDVLQQSNIAVAGQSVYCYLSKTGTLNYFTANLNSGGDSYMMLIDSQGSIAAYNDDFWDSNSAFNWGYSSRIHQSFSNGLDRLVLSTWSSSNPWGMADVYLMNEDSTIGQYDFENLKAIDAIMSAPWEGSYNCIAWSGGHDWDWIWPPSTTFGGVWYDPDPQKAFDNWYGNHLSNGNYYPRYSSAWYYDRASATAENAVVDVWKHPGGDYTHGSVRAKGNAHSHGYDWESKPGGWARTFHPRNALHGASYGEIYQHYFGAGSTSVAQTLSEAVASGTDVIEDVSLTSDERSKLSALKTALPVEKVRLFETMYAAWKKTWSDPKISVHGNPAKYTESKEYNDLYQLCQAEGKALWPLVFEQVFAGDVFARSLVTDITFAQHRSTFERIRSEHQRPKYTVDNKLVVTLPSTLVKKYVQELLAGL